MDLSHLTNGTPLENVLDVLKHVWPIVMFFDHEIGVVLPKMSIQRPSIDLSQNEFSSPTYRDIQLATLEQVTMLDMKVYVGVV